MCAIAGYVHSDPRYVAPPGVLDAARDAMAHRGPDDLGSWSGDGAGLASRRLAILDLSERGRMPMTSEDGRYVIVHNGEVYNYRELREGLKTRGHRFRSDTDTEVLLRSYMERGPALLDDLNGMFAFAVWDHAERTLFVARDRLGVKPLYYAERGGAFWFASEPKALFQAGFDPRFDPGTWEELLCFRYVAGERTPYEGIRRIPPGHCLLWRDGRATLRRWWSLTEAARRGAPVPGSEAPDWFAETFRSAISYRRISDVPIGVLLSGGLDSTSIACVLGEQAGPGLASFTVRFPGTPLDEGKRARAAAGAFGLEHHELEIAPEQLLERLGQASWFNDEPLPHGSDLHLMAISEYARPRVTVLLSGEGADETMGGYARYRPLPLLPWLGWLGPFLPSAQASPALRRAAKLRAMLREDAREGPLLYNTCDVLPADLERLGMRPGRDFAHRRRVLLEAREVYPDDALRQAMYTDQHAFLCSVLDVNDKMTMAASIECRVPFLDYRLVEGCAALPTRALAGLREGKRPLRRAFADRLRPVLGGYRKIGFTAPWAAYFRRTPALRAMLESLPSRDPVRDGPLPETPLRRAIAGFLAGDDRPEAVLRALVMVCSWYEACVGGGRSAAGARRQAGLPQ
ncbi:MAG TPA: asparagine synthase (glutamine-hydrolyzing) [Candidatus Polarisedimenticolia bacterium]|nr:asparagine synthase (glutamine-hydrolyzing) [Candidatus Polarisedimenticolia bacterium]